MNLPGCSAQRLGIHLLISWLSWLCGLSRGLINFGFIRVFKEVFRQVPLRILKEASTSRHLVGSVGLDETAINQLLGPWLKVVSEKPMISLAPGRRPPCIRVGSPGGPELTRGATVNNRT